MFDLQEAISVLVAAQDAHGGWGWRAGGTANTECTALGVLALRSFNELDHAAAGALGKGLAWLSAHQLDDGSWPLSDQVPGSSWTTSLACLAQTEAKSQARMEAVKGGEWLLETRSRRPRLADRIRAAFSSEGKIIDQDDQIPGWGWTQDTTAWVEPTSWALLALKMLKSHLPRGRVQRRIGQGETLLEDRMCRGGGWNYGNKAVLGFDLEPYPDTTALALIALQNRSTPRITRASIERLRDMMRETRSSLALALAVLALQLYGEDMSALRHELQTRSSSHTGDDLRTLSLALLALNRGDVPLRVAVDD